jgi:membrane-associated PAP2 superfamily phosphatase
MDNLKMITDRSRFLLTQTLLLIFSFLILLNFFDIGGVLDLQLIYPFIDDHGQFPLRQQWALAELNHRYVKDLLILVYITLLLAWLASLKWQNWHTRRWEFGYFFSMVVLTTASIGILKSQSAHACPWDMTIPTHNGILWDFSATAGHCFPGKGPGRRVRYCVDGHRRPPAKQSRVDGRAGQSRPGSQKARSFRTPCHSSGFRRNGGAEFP